MSHFNTVATALLALCLFGMATGLALADVQGGDAFRVVGLTGTQALKLRTGPDASADVAAEVPFDARNLRATGVRQGNWLVISYPTGAGHAISGWADDRFLRPDETDQPTLFKIIAARGASIPLLDDASYGVRAMIPASTASLVASAPCQNGYCKVRYLAPYRSIEGFVAQGYLEVEPRD